MKKRLIIPTVLASVLAAVLVTGCGPKPQPFKTFTAADPVVGPGITVEGDAWRADCTASNTVQLFELPDPGLEQCTVIYRAKLKETLNKGWF